MFQILLSPKQFFESCAGFEPSLKKPALIILLISIFTGISGYMVGELTGKLLSGIMEGLELITVISTTITSFIAAWIMWLVAAIVLLIMVKILKGTGSFKRYAEIAGYGMLPQLIGTIISTGIAFGICQRSR